MSASIKLIEFPYKSSQIPLKNRSCLYVLLVMETVFLILPALQFVKMKDLRMNCDFAPVLNLPFTAIFTEVILYREQLKSSLIPEKVVDFLPMESLFDLTHLNSVRKRFC